MPDPAPAATLLKQDFAKCMGVTPTRIGQLIKRGLPVEADGRIDEKKARAWCDKHQLGGHQKRPGTLSEVKLQFEREKLRKIRLELAEVEGTLVNRADVTKLIFNHRKSERDAHIAWVMRTAPALATELGVDAAWMFAALDAAMREHLYLLSVEPVGGVVDGGRGIDG